MDNNEPEDIERLIKQSVEVVRMPLNMTHRSDYFFADASSKTHQFSRKQAGELLNDIDEAEDQIRDYYNNADYNYQIVEGVISPVPLVKNVRDLDQISVRGMAASPYYMFSYKVESNGYLHDEKVHKVSPSLYYSWIFRLWMSNVPTLFTVNWEETAKLLAALYKNCQKPEEEHNTLRRVIKSKLNIRSPNKMAPDELIRHNYIKCLMGLVGAGLGEKSATLLVDKFGSPFSLFMAEEKDIMSIEGFGKKSAEKIFKAIGREVE